MFYETHRDASSSFSGVFTFAIHFILPYNVKQNLKSN